MRGRALLSVSDKTGLAEFGRGLSELGWTLLSTGGTARALREAGLEVVDVSEVTGHPEMMEGRVKTLHPAVHAGLLARRDRADDLAALEAHGYGPIDLVAVNLYRFREAVEAGAAMPAAMEKVDIGGPTMLRAAAKNHEDVLAVVDPSDYGSVLDALATGGVSDALRRELAAKVFEHTAAYDAAIAAYFADRRGAADDAAGFGARASGTPGGETGGAEFAETVTLELRRVQPLRYGENPDQGAAFYAEAGAPPGSLPSLRQRHGKELSFNNLLDIDAAIAAASAWQDSDAAACVIVKHTTPCGIALAPDAATAFADALACDPVSAFGGIVALNVPVDAAVAEQLAGLFLEIIVAPGFERAAFDRLSQKKNLRLIELPITRPAGREFDFKRVRGGFLVQDRLDMSFAESGWRVATKRAPEPAEMETLRFAWRAVASVKSNAIVLAHGRRTIGIGAGQMSRVDASRIAVMKAADQNADTKGAALASDAFFPFRDGIDAAAAAGVRSVIQPGGSVRDDEVTAAADEHGIAMVLTGRRVFRH